MKVTYYKEGELNISKTAVSYAGYYAKKFATDAFNWVTEPDNYLNS